jgi:tetratricopeptide (TPR) repeat protein
LWVSDSLENDLAALKEELESKIDTEASDVVIGFVGRSRDELEHRLLRLGHSDTPGRYLVISHRAGRDMALVLLHELAHAFGVPHVRDVPSIMNEELHRQHRRFDPASSAILRNNARMDFQDGDPFAGCRLETLQAIYDDLAERGNPVADLIAVVGESYRLRGQPSAAEGAYRRALRLDPDLVSAKLGLGVMALRSGRPSEAANLLEEVQRASPDLPGVEINLAIAYTRLGQTASAIRSYERALDLNPENVVAMNNLGLLYSRDDDVERAEEMFRSAVRIDPDFVEAWNNLGVLYEETDRADEAIRVYETSLSVRETAQAHRNLASVLLDQGRRDEAREHMKASLEIDPHQPGADQMRRWLSLPR